MMELILSMSKRLLFGDNPADDVARQRLVEATQKFLEPFTFKISTRRRNRLAAGPYWDTAWGSTLRTAADDLDIKAVQINSQFCVRTQAEADAIRARAETLHQASLERYGAEVRAPRLPGARTR
jgi:hypothetical protein